MITVPVAKSGRFLCRPHAHAAPRRRAATVAAAADDVPMREADADLGFDDERDGARAGALCLAPRVRSQLAQDFRAAAGGEEEGRSARGGNGCSRPIECLRTTGAALSRARETTPAARQIRIHTRDRPSHWRRVGMAASAGARRVRGSEEEAATAWRRRRR